MNSSNLHPGQFQVNQAWIAFTLNEAPLRTRDEGDFNIFALMDAASCVLLAQEFVPAEAAGPSMAHAKGLFKAAEAQGNQLPKTLFIPADEPAWSLSDEARRLGIEVVRISPEELLPFIGEAREMFRERFGGNRPQ
jgi:hypothetical protein